MASKVTRPHKVLQTKAPSHMTQPEQFYSLGDDDTIRRHIRIERENGKKLRKTPWWKAQIQKGECHFCHQQVGAENLTMDHVVPLARKGKSTRGNVVPACQACNRSKNLTTPVETLLDQIKAEGDEPPDF